MAGPHVAGLVALLVAANPALAGDVAGIENIINQSALPLTTTDTCGGIPAGQVPNNTFGYGRIDALAAYDLATATGVASSGESVPVSATLLSNRPNPFNPFTVIDYTLPGRSAVTLRVYDVAGRRVKELVRTEEQAAGTHTVTWDGVDDAGRAAPSGVYFYRLETDGYDETKRMTLIR